MKCNGNNANKKTNDIGADDANHIENNGVGNENGVGKWIMIMSLTSARIIPTMKCK